MGVTDASDSRLRLLREWVIEDLGFAQSRIEPASADASFRRYFRVFRGADTCIVMDAPPDKEDVGPFVSVARLLAGMGLNVPIILASDTRQGFLLLSDLGNDQYMDHLSAGREVERLYADAMQALARLQSEGRDAAQSLPPYDRALLTREMDLLPDWFLAKHLELDLKTAERDLLQRLSGTLSDAALEQPVTFVHRDYHSRNLLVTTERNPGILDFQDAVCGPLTYDLVSLLKDAYVAWPPQRVRQWALQFRERLIDAGLDAGASDAQFLRWFDLMGLQRHVKVLGIFARLYYRDGKSRYLWDLPRVFEYAQSAAASYAETAEFADFLAHLKPQFERAQAGIPK